MPDVRLCSIDKLPARGHGAAFWIDSSPPDGSSSFYLSMLPAGKRRVAVFHTAQGYRACDDRCPHQEAPLVGGVLHGCTVTCNWHFWQFDLDTGANALSGDSTGLRLYKLRIEGNDVFITLDGGA